MLRPILRFATVIGLISVAGLRAENGVGAAEKRTLVLDEILSAPDKGIPDDLLDKAYCVVVVPGVKKIAFGVGAKYGRGFISCRDLAHHTGWGAPGAVRMEGGTLGFQIGASETDVVMLVMNESGMRRLLQSKFTLGAKAGVAAGPVGRTASAETDARLTAGILSWSRSRGVFAGLSVGGATLRNDLDQNQHQEIVRNKEARHPATRLQNSC